MFKKPSIKIIGQAALIAGVGFVLLNAAFMFDFAFQTITISIINLFTSVRFMQEGSLFPPVMHILFVLIILMLSWLVFRTKFDDLIKATFSVVPEAAILVTFGIFLYKWPIWAFICGTLFTSGVLYYLFRTKQSWHYYYAVLLISIVLAVGSLLGMEI